MFQKYFKSQSGVTLIESLVAMMVVVVGLVAILSLALSSLTRAKVSKEQIVATTLVREGIEIVRTIRDTNWLINIECWDELSNYCGLENGLYALDYNNATAVNSSLSSQNIEDFNLSSCDACILKKESDVSNFYVYNGTGEPTIYRRVIQIDNFSIDTGYQAKRVRSKVFWNARGKDFFVEAETILTNWR